MNAFIKFNRGMLKLPAYWQPYLILLASANAVAPLFFLHHLEAQLVLLAFLASMALMTFLTARFGFTRILGLGHVFWIPLLAFLFTRLDDIPAGGAFGIWIRTLIVLNTISLVIDTVDVTRYIGGERHETVPGL